MKGNIYRLFFKAFSNTTRLGIITALKKNPLTVTEIAKKLHFEQSRVSHNLRCLENCGFVTATSNGRWKRYALEKDTILPIIRLYEKHIKRYKKRLQECRVICK